MTEINTHDLIVDFGKHKGERWTRVPVSYLKWLANTATPNGNSAIATAELERRGTVTPTIEVSGHAIDRASLTCRNIWHQTKRTNSEGLHAWLCRVASEALEAGVEDDQGRRAYLGMKFAFEQDGVWPVLVTVMPK